MIEKAVVNSSQIKWDLLTNAFPLLNEVTFLANTLESTIDFAAKGTLGWALVIFTDISN